MPLNVSSTRQALIDLINAENPSNKKTLSLLNVTLGNPAIYDGGSAAAGPDDNTTVKVSAIQGKGFRGDVDVFYRRLNTEEIFGYTEYGLMLENAAATEQDMVEQLIDELTVSWDLPFSEANELSVRDFTFAPANEDFLVASFVADFSTNFVLRESLAVYAYFGKPHISTIITQTHLTGYDPRYFDPAGSQFGQ